MMNDKPGVLLVRRVRAWKEGLAKKPRNAAVALSEDELARAYRGIDGAAWPDEIPLEVQHESGLASLDSWPAVAAAALAQVDPEKIYDAIIVARKPLLTTSIPAATFLGFDVGFYNDEYSVFSSIFHEAIHSSQAALRAYATRLNDALLLATVADAEDYCRTRATVRAAARDVEDADCYPIAIFGQRPPRP